MMAFASLATRLTRGRLRDRAIFLRCLQGTRNGAANSRKLSFFGELRSSRLSGDIGENRVTQNHLCGRYPE